MVNARVNAGSGGTLSTTMTTIPAARAGEGPLHLQQKGDEELMENSRRCRVKSAAAFNRKIIRPLTLVDRVGKSPLEERWTMATNSFIEFRLDEAQTLADYTGISFDLQTAREFATTILEETRKPAPNFSLSDPFMVATIIRYARAFAGGVPAQTLRRGCCNPYRSATCEA